MQGALFAAINAGPELARDIETGFLNRLALTPLRRAALLLGQLAGVMTVARAVVADLPRRRADRRAASSRPASAACVVLFVLAFLVALAFAALGALRRAAHRVGRGGAGPLPAPLRPALPVVAGLPRPLIEQDWFRTVATWNPVSYLVEGIRSLVITGWDARARSSAASRSRSCSALLGIFGASRALRTRLERT